jgi:hypothetical protein
MFNLNISTNEPLSTHITHQHVHNLGLFQRLSLAFRRLAFEDEAKSVLIGHIEKCECRNGRMDFEGR